MLFNYNLICTSIFCLVLFSSCSSNEVKQKDVNADPPNIVFILVDDMGWNEVGFNNESQKLTPYIDVLRSEGVSLTQFYVHAVCAPSRAAFLTGRYPFRTWTDWRSEDFGKPTYLEKLGLTITRNEEGDETRRIHALSTQERTIAEALEEVGYFTAIAGKWGVGEWLDEHLPMGQGFMYQYGHYAWGIDYTNFTIPHNAPARYAVYDWHRNQEPLYEQGYTTDLIANEVVRLIANHKTDHAEMPFFYYVPFNAIHGPLEEIPRYTDLYTRRLAAIKCLDDAVGRIIATIDQHGYKDNTLVVFANDNGAIRENMNAPYRGTKNTNYEGGIRVPCVMRWPGKIVAGSSNDKLMHITDLYSTFIKIGGGSLDQEFSPDGMDMSGVLFRNENSPREEIIFEVSGSVRRPSIRIRNYKLIGDELYDLSIDPGEQNDISSTSIKVVDQLKKRLEIVGQSRPHMPDMSLMMTPALPWVYGQVENENAPQWVVDHVSRIRDMQPKDWAEGTTPWPQAPKDGIIIYTGDGR